MRRQISQTLLAWKAEKHRKVALLRGARQVGKTYIIRELGQEFDHYLEVNFEENRDVHQFFKGNLNPELICENLSAYYGRSILPGKTLLFFDEIQSCPEAIQSLRFFHEKLPALHVIAAGSLLEFALSELPTFGVGRIQSFFMYPMSFDEFLLASDEDQLLASMRKASSAHPLPIPLHQKLIDHFKRFLLVGGLPEVVKTYIESKDLNTCQAILDTLLLGLNDDFAKYKNRVPSGRLREIFDSIAQQTGGKFILNRASQNSNHGQIKEALELLCQAGIAYKICHSSANGIPLGAEVNPRKFKVILFDTGLHQRVLGLDLGQQLLADDFNTINRGSIAELHVGIELHKKALLHSGKAYYWHRESKSSNAEVDYMIQKNDKIIPIEVKAGTKGQMQSMFLFLKEKKYEKGLRLSIENFSSYPPIDVLPLYATGNI